MTDQTPREVVQEQQILALRQRIEMWERRCAELRAEIQRLRNA